MYRLIEKVSELSQRGETTFTLKVNEYHGADDMIAHWGDDVVGALLNDAGLAFSYQFDWTCTFITFWAI